MLVVQVQIVFRAPFESEVIEGVEYCARAFDFLQVVVLELEPPSSF